MKRLSLYGGLQTSGISFLRMKWKFNKQTGSPLSGSFASATLNSVPNSTTHESQVNPEGSLDALSAQWGREHLAWFPLYRHTGTSWIRVENSNWDLKRIWACLYSVQNQQNQAIRNHTWCSLSALSLVASRPHRNICALSLSTGYQQSYTDPKTAHRAKRKLQLVMC